jgi:hypothetical protein
MTRTNQAARKAGKMLPNPEDTLHFRMQQAHGAALALMWQYFGQSDDEMMHLLSPWQMKDALWAIVELTRQGRDASKELGYT